MSGHEDLSGHGPPARFTTFQNRLDSFQYNHGPFTTIAYEKPMHHKGVYAAHMFGGFEALTLVAAHRFSCNIIHFTPSQIKKAVTGNGRASKLMIIRTLNQHGHSVSDDNQADAVAIMLCARRQIAQGQN